MAAHVVSIGRGVLHLLQRTATQPARIRSRGLRLTVAAPVCLFSFNRRCSSLQSVIQHNQHSTHDLTCGGCGTKIHSSTPNTQGYLPLHKANSIMQVNESDESSNADPVCQRCFYLTHYNKPLNVTLPSHDYLNSLAHLKKERALILIIVDATDFPSSLFPSLRDVLSSRLSTVCLVVNKIDLMPLMSKSTLNNFNRYLKTEVQKSISDIQLSDIFYVSAKTGKGLEDMVESIYKEWARRGDIYLLGCTNVGKSSLFKSLLPILCGVHPGQVRTANGLKAPSPTISHWPGTTLGLLKFPMLSVGKRLKLTAKANQKGITMEELVFDKYKVEEGEDNFSERSTDTQLSGSDDDDDEVSEKVKLLNEIGIKRKRNKRKSVKIDEEVPKNRNWLIDTPGAVNDMQVINHLTTKELNLVLPKKRLSPRTVILKPGQSVLIGGLARLDFTEGDESTYFTIFASSYLPLHTTRCDKADDVYARNLGKPLLKIPAAGNDSERLSMFPPLESKGFTMIGGGGLSDGSVSDIILSSVGWVAVTSKNGKQIKLLAYTPNGKGIFIRSPSLFPHAVDLRGKRSRIGNRTMFHGKPKPRHKIY